MKLETNGKEAKARLHQVNALIAEKNLAFRRRGQELRVLIESQEAGRYSGLDQFFNRIWVESEHALGGQWLEICEYEVNERGNYAKV